MLEFGECSIMGNLDSVSISGSDNWDIKLTCFRNNGRGNNCLGLRAGVLDCRITN